MLEKLASNINSIHPSVFNELKRHAQHELCYKVPLEYTYHNYSHTRNVVYNALEIAKRMDYRFIDLQLIELTAWYHDIGFVQGAKNHEQRGSETLGVLMHNAGLDSKLIKKAHLAIMSTIVDNEPLSEYGAILKDADTGHLAYADYSSFEALLRKEILLVEGKEYSDYAWKTFNNEFLKKHTFYTEVGKQLYNPGKKINYNKSSATACVLSN